MSATPNGKCERGDLNLKLSLKNSRFFRALTAKNPHRPPRSVSGGHTAGGVGDSGRFRGVNARVETRRPVLATDAPGPPTRAGRRLPVRPTTRHGPGHPVRRYSSWGDCGRRHAIRRAPASSWVRSCMPWTAGRGLTAEELQAALQELLELAADTGLPIRYIAEAVYGRDPSLDRRRGA